MPWTIISSEGLQGQLNVGAMRVQRYRDSSLAGRNGCLVILQENACSVLERRKAFWLRMFLYNAVMWFFVFI